MMFEDFIVIENLKERLATFGLLSLSSFTCHPQQVEDSISPPTEMTFGDFIAIKDLKERLETFDLLPESKKLFLLYPTKARWLPERDPYPENWEVMLTRAKDVAKKTVQDGFRKKQAPVPAAAAAVNPDSDDSEDEDEGLHEKNVLDSIQGSPTKRDETNQLLFLDNLKRCLPIVTYGFHVDKHNRATNDACCFCPCDRDPVAGRWRKLCGMDDILCDSICIELKQTQMSPKPFLDHLKSKAQSCVFHGILHSFLGELFSEFNGLDDNNKRAKHNERISLLCLALVDEQKSPKSSKNQQPNNNFLEDAEGASGSNQTVQSAGPTQAQLNQTQLEGRQSKFQVITRRGTNTNSDSCFYYPTCASVECGGKRECCQFHKQWEEMFEDEEEFFMKNDAAMTAAGPVQCCFYPVCTSRVCGGQSGQRQGCQIRKDWIEAHKETAEFFRRKNAAKAKQKSGRTMAFRAARKKEKERMLRSCIFNEPTI
jgi:hypothetical protein